MVRNTTGFRNSWKALCRAKVGQYNHTASTAVGSKQGRADQAKRPQGRAVQLASGKIVFQPHA